MLDGITPTHEEDFPGCVQANQENRRFQFWPSLGTI